MRKREDKKTMYDMKAEKKLLELGSRIVAADRWINTSWSSRIFHRLLENCGKNIQEQDLSSSDEKWY